MSKFTFFFLAYLSFALNINAQCDDRFNEAISDTFILHQDIKYGRNITSIGDNIDLLLDIFEPSEPSLEPRPVIILAHGGSFVNGSKEVNEVRWFCEDLAKRGFVTASINYRLEPDFLSIVSKEKMIKAVIRATEDVKASIRYFYKSATEDNPYNIDTNYIVAGGVSAGSIAVLHSIFADKFYQFPTQYQEWIFELNGDSTLQGNSGNAGYSDKVAGVINVSGGLISPTHMKDNIDIPLLSMHNTIDLTIQFGWGPPYFLPFLPNLAGSQVLHKNFRNYLGYSDLYAVNELNHVPHTKFEDGSKNIPVYDESMNRIAKLMRYIIPCTEIPTSFNTSIAQQFTVFPNPAKDILEIKGLENINDFQFKLIDVSGKVIESDLLVSNEKVILKSSLNGIYFLVGTNTITSEMATSKVLIQN